MSSVDSEGSGSSPRARRRYRIALIPGDGIGQEVVPEAARVLDALGLGLDYVHLDAGWATFERDGNALPQATVDALRTCDGALFGAVSSPSKRTPGYSSPILQLRKLLDLYGNLRPSQSAPGYGARPDVDLLIVRENTECLYVKQERIDADGQRAVAERVITRRASQRIARLAFEQARLRQAARGADVRAHALVTIVHKANVLSLTDGLFRESCLDVAQEYPDVEVEEQLVDSMAYRMILEPQRYDVVVAPEPLWRHSQRCRCGADRRLGPSAQRQCGRQFCAGGAGAWQRAGHRRAGHGESAGCDSLGGPAARHLGEGEAALALEKAVQGALRGHRRSR